MSAPDVSLAYDVICKAAADLSLHQRRGRQDTASLLDHRLSGLRPEEQVHDRQRAADLTLGARSRP
jgi:hypothetical protein